MKKSFKQLTNSFLSGILAILGFSACTGLGTDEYGCPISDFILKGTITDENNRPIEGIQVVGEYDEYTENDTVFTDKNGNYYKKSLIIGTPRTIQIKIMDVDGDANGGAFKTDSVKNEEIDIVQTQKEKGWYKGEFTVTVDKKLKKQ